MHHRCITVMHILPHGTWLVKQMWPRGGGGTDWLLWFVWFVLFIWLNQTNRINQTDQIDQTNQMNRSSCYFAEGRRAHQDARRPCPHEERST
jgi:hypothetical protein